MTVLLFRDGAPRAFIGAFLALAGLLLSTALHAQSTDSSQDNRPPVIELEELSQAAANSSQVFTVQIAEETELRDATLYYRRSGEEPYTSVALEPLGASGFYSVSISADPSDLRAIEYYVQAVDSSDNRTVSGFAFDPYTREIVPAKLAQSASTPIAATGATPFYKKRWFQITLGVVAVGALASSLDSDGEETRVVPVTITLE